MFDIDFYMKYRGGNPEIHRNKVPVVYNIETTNACNMKCRMCPRTTMMTRNIETMDIGLFREIVEQLKPHTPQKWAEWGKFCRDTYGIDNEQMSENHFFLYVIPRIIQLHGYGDPLLDRDMGNRVKILSNRSFDSYFSCNPANIDVNKTVEMFENGLTYIKYSIESTDDKVHKIIRGDKSDFSTSYKNILKVLELKDKWNLRTTVVITMLDLNRPGQDEEFEELKMLFQDRDVYIYFKSQDTQWLNKDYHGTNSIHWSEPCRHPWMSMTIKSNGEATQCMEDFNNAIVLGDTKKESLYDIWNGEKYQRLREMHLNPTSGIQCTDNCDMTLIGDKMNFGGIEVGNNEPVYMIAEIGLNHNGDIQIAKQLIDATFACGWHCAKFQKRTPELCVPEHQKNVPRETPWGTMTYLDYRYKVEFEKSEYGYIDMYCREKPIQWTASAWDETSLEFILKYDVPFIKIPSAKLTDHVLLNKAGRSGKPVILSTGMSTVKEIDDAVDVLSGREFALMHTNSTYPTPLKDLNLKTIQFLKARYGGVVGYSGHEYGLEPTVIAVALGARIIERHVTIDHNMWGSDQQASLEVHAMDMLHKRIKDVDLSVGDGVKRVYDTEVPIRKKLRS